MLTPAQEKFLQFAAQASVTAEKATGCPAIVSLAQSVEESGWGARCPGNNCFGIKSTDTHETYQLTKEFMDGTWHTMRLAFESYPSLADCFAAHGRLIQGGPYTQSWRGYLADKDTNELIRGIGKIYATAPAYTTQILSLAHTPALLEAIDKARTNA